MKLKVVLQPGDDGWIVAEVPALPGCLSQGRTRDEALSNVREAIEGWLETEQEKVQPTSPAQDVELVTV